MSLEMSDWWHKYRLWQEKFLGRVVFKKVRLVNMATMEIVGEFVGNNSKDKNAGGLVVKLKSSNGAIQEVAAVAIERKNSLHPDTSYQDKVDEVLRDAEFTVDRINELLSKYEKGALQ